MEAARLPVIKSHQIAKNQFPLFLAAMIQPGVSTLFPSASQKLFRSHIWP